MHSRILDVGAGRSVIIRPLTPGDVDTVAAVLARSGETGADVSALATVDASRHSLVAYLTGDPLPAAIGQLARVSRTEAEVVLTVADRYEGIGVDNALLELLGGDARAAGLMVRPASAANELERPRSRRFVQHASWAARRA